MSILVSLMRSLTRPSRSLSISLSHSRSLCLTTCVISWYTQTRPTIIYLYLFLSCWAATATRAKRRRANNLRSLPEFVWCNEKTSCVTRIPVRGKPNAKYTRCPLLTYVHIIVSSSFSRSPPFKMFVR